MSKTIDHFGIAVKNLKESIKNFEKAFGLKCGEIEEIKEQSAKLGMIPIQNVNVELLESTDDNSPIAKFINKRGEGFHHIAIRVDDIEKELKRLKKEKVQLINETYKIGAHGAKVAFIHPKSMHGLLVELVERN